MKGWIKLAVAEDRMLMASIDYFLMLYRGNLDVENGFPGGFTYEDADRLANLIRDWEDLAVEMTSEGFDPKKTKEYEARLKEIRKKIEPAWRIMHRYATFTIATVGRRLGHHR